MLSLPGLALHSTQGSSGTNSVVSVACVCVPLISLTQPARDGNFSMTLVLCSSSLPLGSIHPFLVTEKVDLGPLNVFPVWSTLRLVGTGY